MSEIKTFKWGDLEYSQNDLLNADLQQRHHFIKWAKDNLGLDDDSVEILNQEIDLIKNGISSGQTFAGDGSSGENRVTNVNSNLSGKNKRKYEREHGKGARPMQDLAYAARHYFNKLRETVNPYQKPIDKGNWDISQYGLGAYMSGKGGLKAKDVFEKMDLRDETNPDSPRAYTLRYGLLKEQLTNYIPWLQSENFDFGKNDSKWDDSFLADAEEFLNYLNTTDETEYDNSKITAYMRKLGADDSYITAFTSDKWDLSKTNDELKEERQKAADKKKKEEMDKAWGDEKARRYGIYAGLSDLRSGQMLQYMGKDKIFDLTDEDIEHHMASKKINGAEAEKAYWDNLDLQYAENPYDISIAQLVLPMRARQGVLKSIDNGDYAGWSYDPSTINDSRQSVMAFDPTTGKMEEIFIGHLTNDWARIKNQFMQKHGYTDPLAAFAKEGGVLEFQTEGTFSSYDYIQSYKKDKNAERAQETGNSEDVQKARDRVVSNGKNRLRSEDDTLAQPDAGFTGAERARLATIAADIGSMFLDPVTGTAVGLGSSLVNFGADIADDGFQWKDVGNLGVNIGFDLLGAIPLFGDAVGTGTKITRSLLKWAPRIMTGLAAYQGIKNFDGMMESWGKLTSGDKDQKMTVQDWRNITLSIGLITGGVRSVRNKTAQSKMKKAALVDDVVGINVTDKNGNKQQILVDGDTAKNIRAAKGDKAKIEAELSKLETFKDSFGEKGTLTIDTKNNGSLQKPISRHEKANGDKEWGWDGFRKEGSADVTDIYDFSKVKGYEKSGGFRIPGVSDWLNTKHQQLITRLNNGQASASINAKGAKTVAEIDAEVKKLQNSVDAEVKKLQESMTKRSKDRNRINKQLTPEKAKLVELLKRLHGVADEPTLQVNRAKAEQDIAGIDANISKMQSDLSTAESNLQSLEGKRVSKKNLATHDQQLNDAKAKVDDIKNQIVLLESAKRTQQAEIAKIDGHINDYAALAPQQTKVLKLQDLYKHLGRGTNTNSFIRLKQMVADLQTLHSTVGGRQINWDMNEILKNAGIKNAYAQGGSINRNKLNKFLNYGKR